jgi:membrane protease YdiL (CAAX protease family)
MKFHWPPRPLGLGPPLNLVSFSREHRAKLGKSALQSIALAIVAAVVIAAIDGFFFGGVTTLRTPALDQHPTPAMRVVISFVGGFLEELVFRVIFATGVAAVVWYLLRLVRGERPSHVAPAQWTGTIAAMVFVGVWHVGMVGDPSANDVRVLVVNGVSNLVYGWTYWRRGLEMSTLAHGVLNATLYLGLPLLH